MTIWVCTYKIISTDAILLAKKYLIQHLQIGIFSLCKFAVLHIPCWCLHMITTKKDYDKSILLFCFHFIKIYKQFNTAWSILLSLLWFVYSFFQINFVIFFSSLWQTVLSKETIINEVINFLFYVKAALSLFYFFSCLQ